MSPLYPTHAIQLSSITWMYNLVSGHIPNRLLLCLTFTCPRPLNPRQGGHTESFPLLRTTSQTILQTQTESSVPANGTVQNPEKPDQVPETLSGNPEIKGQFPLHPAKLRERYRHWKVPPSVADLQFLYVSVSGNSRRTWQGALRLRKGHHFQFLDLQDRRCLLQIFE